MMILISELIFQWFLNKSRRCVCQIDQIQVENCFNQIFSTTFRCILYIKQQNKPVLTKQLSLKRLNLSYRPTGTEAYA